MSLYPPGIFTNVPEPGRKCNPILITVGKAKVVRNGRCPGCGYVQPFQFASYLSNQSKKMKRTAFQNRLGSQLSEQVPPFLNCGFYFYQM